MWSESELAEAGIVSLKSQLEACHIQLHEAENHLSSRHTELEQLELKLVETSVQVEKLSNKVQLKCVISHKCPPVFFFFS